MTRLQTKMNVKKMNVKDEMPVVQATTVTAPARHSAAAHSAKVYCPMCTHTVEAMIEHTGRHAQVQAGQKCPRCSGALDAGYIFRMDRAA